MTAMLNQLQRQARPCLKAVDLEGDKVSTHYGDTCTSSSSILHKEIFSEDNVKQSSGWK